MKYLIFLLLFTSSLFAAKPLITVSTPPLHYIVQQVVKNNMRVQLMFEDGNLDHKHRKLQLKNFAKATLFFKTTLTQEQRFQSMFEEFNPQIKTIDLSLNVEKITKDDGSINPYIWMDPLNVRLMVKDVLKAVVAIDPKNRLTYNRNVDQFYSEIDDLFFKIKKSFYTKNDSIFIFDEDWDYFTNRFGLITRKVDKRILEANEISEFARKADLFSTNTILARKGMDYRILHSISSNANEARIIENNVLDGFWQANMLKLSQNILGEK